MPVQYVRLEHASRVKVITNTSNAHVWMDRFCCASKNSVSHRGVKSLHALPSRDLSTHLCKVRHAWKADGRASQGLRDPIRDSGEAGCARGDGVGRSPSPLGSLAGKCGTNIRSATQNGRVSWARGFAPSLIRRTISFFSQSFMVTIVTSGMIKGSVRPTCRLG